MKEALSDLLPRDILRPQEARLRHADGRVAEDASWRRCWSELLSPSRGARARPVPCRRRSRALIADHEANRIDGTDRLLALLNLEIWSRDLPRRPRRRRTWPTN